MPKKKGGTEIGLLSNKVLHCYLAAMEPGGDWKRKLVMYQFLYEFQHLFRSQQPSKILAKREVLWSSVCVLNKHATTVACLCLRCGLLFRFSWHLSFKPLILSSKNVFPQVQECSGLFTFFALLGMLLIFPQSAWYQIYLKLNFFFCLLLKEVFSLKK